MAKVVVQFTCSECGATAGRWLGRCPGCGAFGTLVEELHGSDGRPANGAARAPERLGDVEVSEAARLATGVAELTHLRLTAEQWRESGLGGEVTVHGWDGCAPWFGAA